MAQILLGIYLIVGLLATVIILVALKASNHQKKRRPDNAEYDKVGQHSLFREQKTRPNKST